MKANFRELGKRFAKQTQWLPKPSPQQMPPTLSSSLRSSGSYDLVVNDATVAIGPPDDVVITGEPQARLGGRLRRRGNRCPRP